jgi:hypothetical protein
VIDVLRARMLGIASGYAMPKIVSCNGAAMPD